jgi:hypothetical protein
MQYVRDPLVISGLSGLDIVQLSGADLSMVSHALLLTFNYLGDNRDAELSREIPEGLQGRERIIPSILRKLVDALENQVYFCEGANPAKGGCMWTGEDIWNKEEPPGIYVWNSAYAARAFSLYMKYSLSKRVKTQAVPIALVVTEQQEELEEKEKEKRKLRGFCLRNSAQMYSAIIGFLMAMGLSLDLHFAFLSNVFPHMAKIIWWTFLVIMISSFAQFLRLILSPSGFDKLEDLITEDSCMKRMKTILWLNYFGGVTIFVLVILLWVGITRYLQEDPHTHWVIHVIFLTIFATATYSLFWKMFYFIQNNKDKLWAKVLGTNGVTFSWFEWFLSGTIIKVVKKLTG